MLKYSEKINLRFAFVGVDEVRVESFVDLCSGIGGGRLGLEFAGLKCLAYCDTSRLAIRTYQLMFDTAEETKYSNLRYIKAEEMPQYDFLIAGFPCQTFSVMGRKEGFSDNRGQIIFHLARILRESQPKCFLLENVKGLVTHDQGRTLQIILDELSSAGYVVTHKVLNSLDYGVPQMRQRVYFVGVRKDITPSLEDFCWPEPVEAPSLKGFLVDRIPASSERLEILDYYLRNSTNDGKYSIGDLRDMEGKVLDTRMNDLRIYEGKVPTLRAQRDGILYVRNHEIYQMTGYEALLLQGFPKSYADKVKNAVSDRHLLMQAGNAMTVNVIKELGDSILSYINDRRPSKMAKWEEFEVDCVDYLNRKFGSIAEFTHIGKSDSTAPDIEVVTHTGETFYMEVKQSPAQCGQFVLFPDMRAKSFVYSPLNVTPMNDEAKSIIEHMNQNFEAFKEAGTSGKLIQMRGGERIFAKWIISAYQQKGVRYIITNGYKLLPLERISEFFDITAIYRVKRSGSSTIGKKDICEILEAISTDEFQVQAHRVDKDKLFVTGPKSLDKKKFYHHEREYMFSLRGAEFEIRKLSNTFHANVIFSIMAKDEKAGMSDKDFFARLKA